MILGLKGGILMSKALERERIDNSNGITIVDKNRYGNINEVTHRFSGRLTVEEVIKNMVISRLEEKNIIKK